MAATGGVTTGRGTEAERESAESLHHDRHVGTWSNAGLGPSACSVAGFLLHVRVLVRPTVLIQPPAGRRAGLHVRRAAGRLRRRGLRCQDR